MVDPTQKFSIYRAGVVISDGSRVLGDLLDQRLEDQRVVFGGKCVVVILSDTSTK